MKNLNRKAHKEEIKELSHTLNTIDTAIEVFTYTKELLMEMNPCVNHSAEAFQA